MEKEGWEGRRCRRSHHVREEGICTGSLQDEELGDVDDVLLVQAQLLLQEVTVPVDAALQRSGDLEFPPSATPAPPNPMHGPLCAPLQSVWILTCSIASCPDPRPLRCTSFHPTPLSNLMNPFRTRATSFLQF